MERIQRLVYAVWLVLRWSLLGLACAAIWLVRMPRLAPEAGPAVWLGQLLPTAFVIGVVLCVPAAAMMTTLRRVLQGSKWVARLLVFAFPVAIWILVAVRVSGELTDASAADPRVIAVFASVGVALVLPAILALGLGASLRRRRMARAASVKQS